MYGMQNIGKVTISGMALLTMLCGSSAFAAGPNGNEDFFGRNTGSPMTLPSRPLPIPKPAAGVTRSAPQLFYDDMDNAVILHQPTDEEKFTLNRPFEHDFKRVATWTNTVAVLANRYRELSRILRNMPVPREVVASTQGSNSVSSYKSMLADWYDDSAGWLEDYIKPRPAAATKEELDDALKQMTERSQQLKDQHSSLEQLDTKLRDELRVRHFQDAVWALVKRPLAK